jgi:ATP-binding cassette subfamily B protein
MKSETRFKIYKQQNAVDCGPTCLKMVVKQFGKNISIQLLRDLCHTTREGSSIKSIINASEELGIKTIALKSMLDNGKSHNSIPVLKELPFPLIAHWKKNHFVVIYKYQNDKYYIADPALGKLILSQQDVKKHLCVSNDYGKVIIFEITNKFSSNKNSFFNNQSIANKLDLLKGLVLANRNSFLILLLLMIFQLAIQLTSPYLTQLTFDSGILQGNLDVLVSIFIVQTIIYIFSSFINYANGIISNKIAQTINLSLSNSFITKLFKIPIDYFQKQKRSDFIHKVYDINKIESFLTYNLSSIALSVLGVIALSILAIYYNFVAFLIILIFSFINVVWTGYSIRKQRELNYDKFDIQVKTHRYLSEIIEGINDIKLNGSESTKVELLLNNQQNFFSNNLKFIKLTQLLSIGSGFVNNMSSGIMVFYTAYLTIKNIITIGEMAALQLIINQLSSMVSSLISSVRTVQETKYSLERVLETQLIKDEIVGSIEIREISSIRFIDVCFSYTKLSGNVLNNIDLVIESGKTTAIVGESGSGKTTLLKLALGLYNQTTGKILVGNLEQKDYNNKKWRKKCGAVMQDGYLFTDSIKNNITDGIVDKDYSKYTAALKHAAIFDFVNNLPLKSETIIGKDGLNLSHGQKQRILLARMIYREPDYIFLDEATNSLDSQTERIVIDNLANIFTQTTKLIIAHRLNTIINADKIIVLKEGKIVEQGSHNYLLSKRNYYYDLIQEQINE